MLNQLTKWYGAIEIDKWRNWDDKTEMIWYEFVEAKRKSDKIKQHYMQLKLSLTKNN